MLTSERLGSYLRWSDRDVGAAFSLYEWNMSATSAVMHTTGMVEVIVRKAMDSELQGYGRRSGMVLVVRSGAT